VGDPDAATPLFLAIAVGGVALALRARAWDRGDSALWCLVLAGVGVRYAELVIWFRDPLPIPLLGGVAFPSLVGSWATALGFLSMVGAFLYLLSRYLPDPPGVAPRTYQLVLLLLLTGFLFGTARRLTADLNHLGVTLTLALVRPLVFLEARSRLEGGHLWSSDLRRPLGKGAVGYLGALVGVGIGGLVGFGTPGLLLTGAGCLPLGVLAGSVLLETVEDLEGVQPAREPDTGRDPGWGGGSTGSCRVQPAREPDTGRDPPDWPVDDEKVTLPPDWRDRSEGGLKRYRSLDGETRERSRGATRRKVLRTLDESVSLSDVPGGLVVGRVPVVPPR
jgi:hypothetical protein